MGAEASDASRPKSMASSRARDARGDRLAPGLRDAREPLPVADVDASALRFVAKRAVHGRAQDVDAVARTRRTHDADEPPPVVAESHVAARLTLGEERVGETELRQHAQTVGGDLEGAAHVFGARVGFEHDRLDAGACPASAR